MKKFVSLWKEVMSSTPTSKPESSTPSVSLPTPSSSAAPSTPQTPSSSNSTPSSSTYSSAAPSPSPSQKPFPGSYPSSPSGSVSSSSSFKKVTIRELLDPSFDLHQLSIRQMKHVLVNNCINVRHALEKSDLVILLENLIMEYKKEIQLDSKYCKICMEVPSNCVLLECGHMGICVTCAKQCTECPFCRQNIVRVVHTFTP